MPATKYGQDEPLSSTQLPQFWWLSPFSWRSRRHAVRGLTFHPAVRIGRYSRAGLLDGMREEIPPHGLVKHRSGRGFDGRSPGHDGRVGPTRRWTANRAAVVDPCEMPAMMTFPHSRSLRSAVRNCPQRPSGVIPGGAACKDAEGNFVHEPVWRYLFLHPVDETAAAITRMLPPASGIVRRTAGMPPPLPGRCRRSIPRAGESYAEAWAS